MRDEGKGKREKGKGKREKGLMLFTLPLIRFHLSTLLVLQIAAGVLLFLNLRMRPGESYTMGLFSDYGNITAYYYGWPFTNYVDICAPPDKPEFEVIWKQAAMWPFNVACGLLILAVLCFACEHVIRLRSLKRSAS